MPGWRQNLQKDGFRLDSKSLLNRAPGKRTPTQSCPLKAGTPGKRISVYPNQLRQRVLRVTLAMSFWKSDSTPQMFHPHHHKGCVQPHTLSKGDLQGHPKKCLLLVKGMLGVLDPTLLSQSSSVSLGCFLGVEVGRIVPQPHASGRRSIGTHPSTLQPWQWCVSGGHPRSVPQPCTSADTAPTGSPGQRGVPRPTAPPQPQDSKESQSCSQAQHRRVLTRTRRVPRAVHNTGTTAQHQPTPRSPELS